MPYRVKHYSEGGLFLPEGENVCLRGDYQELKILLKNHLVESFCWDERFVCVGRAENFFCHADFGC